MNMSPVGLTPVVPIYFSVSQASEAAVCQAYFSLLIYLLNYLTNSLTYAEAAPVILWDFDF